MTTTDIPPVTRAPFVERFRSLIPFLTLGLLYAITIILAPGYREPQQLNALMQLAVLLGIVSIGQTLVILIAGIDLSVSAVMTFTNLITGAILAGSDVNAPVALAASLGFGVVVGVFNGLVITWLKVPDLVATLATMTIVIGLGYIVTNGAPRGTSSPGLNSFMTGRVFGFVTLGALLWAALAAVIILMLSRTSWGRQVYAVGLNREASRYAGVSVHRITIIMYTISGLMAGLAGFLLTGYTGSSYLGSGTSYQLASIAAVVLGGTSIFGGRGGYVGTIAGVLIIVLLGSLLRVVGIPQAGQNIAYGAVILAMLLLFSTRRAQR